MSKVALADVIWNAANTRLWDCTVELDPSAAIAPLSNQRVPHRAYSCDAVLAEVCCAGFRTNDESVRVREFLKACGCPIYGMDAFADAPEGEPRQAARYLWLLLAAKVAEDEGIEIEVGSAS